MLAARTNQEAREGVGSSDLSGRVWPLIIEACGCQNSNGIMICQLDKDYYSNQQIPPGILLGLSSSSKGIKDSNGQIAKSVRGDGVGRWIVVIVVIVLVVV